MPSRGTSATNRESVIICYCTSAGTRTCAAVARSWLPTALRASMSMTLAAGDISMGCHV
jgi:hypothetical protein